MKWFHQWVTFAIHVPSQPNVPCQVCGQNATWLLLEWADIDGPKPEEIYTKAYCDKHSKDAQGE